MSKLSMVVVVAVVSLLALFVTSAYGQETATLTIRSQYGTPSPPVGTHTYTTGTSITASVATPVYGSPGIRYVCTGWRARGSPDTLPAEGTGNSVTFQITMNTTLTWRWKTQYLLTTTASPASAGAIGVSPTSTDGYHDAKSAVTLTAVNNVGYHFSYWTGGLRGTVNPQNLLMRGPRTVTANFILKPVADFACAPTSGNAPLTVQFTDASTGAITSWLWNFGTGATPPTANTQGPHSVTYIRAGLRTVSLKVMGPGGLDTKTKVDYINVLPGAPVANFVASLRNAIAPPVTVHFADESTGDITSWEWDFDDNGTVDSTEQNPSHAYIGPGVYKVKLTVMGPGGQDEERKNYIRVCDDANAIYVTSGGNDANDGLSWETSVKTIQRGINLASNDWSVRVAKGTYKGIGNVNLGFGGKAIHLKGVEAGLPYDVETDWIIDGENISGRRGFIFQTSEVAHSVVDNFTIQKCNAGPGEGGGIYCNGASPTIINCTIMVNRASEGGGIYCEAGSNPTITNCTIRSNQATARDGGGIYCYNSSPRITGCTIDSDSAVYSGGGIYCSGSSPIIANCTMNANTAGDQGGGIYCFFSNPTITGCTITSGWTGWYGGGVYCEYSAPTITDCTIGGGGGGNTANDAGGGICCFDNSSPLITNCSITGNTATDLGGGIYCETSTPTITNCTIGGALGGNSAGDLGGGVCLYNTSPRVTNCVIMSNTAANAGGGIECWNNSSPPITNCLIANNSTTATTPGNGNGGGIDCYDSSPTVANCTIMNNTATSNGGGIYCWVSSPMLNNTILWGNSATLLGHQICTWKSGTYPCNVTLKYSDYADNTLDPNNIAGLGTVTANNCIVSDPLFVDASSGDYRLQATSPCVDAGSNALVPPNITTDLGGNPRIQKGVVDIGAYEYPGLLVPMYYLAINPSYGSPQGTGWYIEGATAHWSVTSPWPGATGVQYVTSPTEGDVVMDLPKTVTVSWTTQYQLTITISPSGAGTVSQTPDSTWYNSGTVVTLTAIDNGEYNFSYWSGDLSGSENAKNLTMDSPKTVTANFILEKRYLTVNSAYGEPNPAAGTYEYDYSSTVNANCGPTPYSGGTGIQYVCTGHTGTGDVTSGSETSISFVITLGSSVTWSWQTQYYLTVTSDYGNPQGEGWYNEGTTASWSVISPWPGGIGIQYLADPSSGSVLMDAPKTVAVSWTTRYQLTTSVNPPNGGSVTPISGGWYDAGSVVECNATEAAGYGWAGWSGDLSGTERPKNLTMNGPKSVTANFLRPTLTVSNPSGYDTPTPPVGTCAYDYGVTVTCSVTSPATQFTEGFEAGNINGWTTGGSSNWSAATSDKHSGTYSAQSGALSYGQTNYIQRTFTIGIEGGTVRFWWKATSSSSSNRLRFYIDGSQQTYIYNSAWASKTYSLSAGTRTLKWECYRGSSSYSISGYIDDIAITNVAAADPNTQYVCTGYTGTGSCPASGTESLVTFTITENSSITWNWKTQYRLTIAVSPANSGSVTLTPAGGWYDPDTVVSCNATEAAGYGWSGWSGDLTGTQRPQNITMDAPKRVTANFLGLTLTVSNPSGYGAPNPPVGTQYYGYGATITCSVISPAFATTFGAFTEGFEQGMSGWWMTGGDANWFRSTRGPNSGAYAAESGDIPDSPGAGLYTETWLERVFVIGGGGGDISFWWTVSSERNYDFLEFYIDGVLQAGKISSATSGVQTPWAQMSFSLAEGIHTIKWRYMKDSSVSSGWDGGLVDDIQVTNTVVVPYTNYVCTGYTGTGSCPNGSGSSVTFTITENSTITWNWKAQYKLTVSVAPASSGAVTAEPSSADGYYDPDTTVSLTATGNAPYGFSFWSGDLTGTTNPQNITMNGPKSVTANFRSGVYTLTVYSAYGEPNPSVGTHDYLGGEPITLSCGTTPYPGTLGTRYVCTGWAGGSGDIPATGSATSYSFTITQNCTITWAWQTQYQLTTSVSPPDSGSVTPASGGWYNVGTVVSCNATANLDYGFVNWSGDLTGTTNSQDLTMDGPKSITANFANVTLIVFNPSGYGAPNPAVGTYSCSYGAEIACSVTSPWFGTPTTIFNGTFDAGNLSDWTTGGDANWSITTAERQSGLYSARSGAIGDSGTTYIQKILTIPAAGGTLTFWWKVSSEPNYDFLRFDIDGAEQAAISGETEWAQASFSLTAGIRILRWRYAKDESYTAGSDCGWLDTVLVTVTPNTQYVCTGYTGTGSCPSGSESSVTFTIAENSTITWNWKTQYRLVLVTNPVGGGALDIFPPGESYDYYDAGAVLTLTASAFLGYEFGNWSGDLTGTDNPHDLTMDSPKSVTANFIGPIKPADLTGTPNSATAITWSWAGSSDWQSIAAGVLRTIATTLQEFQTTYGDLPPSEPCPRTGTGNDRLLFEAADDLPDMPDVQDCPTISAASAQTYTITYTRTDASHWTCTADTDRTDLNDYYIDQAGALLQAPSTGDGPQANLSSPISPDNVWFEIQNSAHASVVPYGTVIYPNITSYQETGLLENTQYTRHVHAVNYGVYSDPTNEASRYTLVHNATTDDFTLDVSSLASNRTIGSGTNSQNYPIDISCNYARSQMLYKASEIGSAGVISRIRFQRSSGDASAYTINNAKVYIVQTTQSELTGWVDTSTHIEVFSGNLTVPADAAGTWFEIPLTTPIGYDGSRNIIISFRHQDGTKEGAYTTWRNHTTGAPYPQNYYHRAVAGASDTVNPPAVATVNDRPNVQFEFGGTVTITVAAPPNSTVGSTGVRIERAPNNSFTPAQTVVIQPFAATYMRTDSIGSGTWWYRIRFRNADAITSSYSPGQSITFHILVVTSAYGSPDPAVGTHTYLGSEPVTVSCGTTPYPPGATGTRYICTGWIDGSGDIPATGSATSYSFTITQNCTITWAWQTQYQLTTSVSPANSGIVTPASGSWYDAGTVVSCNASAYAGYGFANWSGGLSGTENPKNLTMNEPKSVTANFNPVP